MNETVAVQAIIQARAGSTRLPGKAAAAVGGRSLLAWSVERARACAAVDRVVVATSTLAGDDATAEAAAALGVAVVRGSVDDVLERFVAVLDQWPAGTVVRLTADNPLLDPEGEAAMVAFHRSRAGAYTVLDRPVPLGTLAEVVEAEALRVAHRETADPHCREHVTPYLYTHPERFRCLKAPAPAWLAGRGYRLTVDTAEDLALMRELHRRLAERGEPFDARHAVALLDGDRELAAMNAGVRQKRWRE